MTTTRATVKRRALAVVSTLLLGAALVVASTPIGASAAVNGVAGRVADRDGDGVGQVLVGLFRANADGSRGTWLGDTMTGDDGAYHFRGEDGCYIVTMVAPDNTTFVSGSRWHQGRRCVSGGATDRGFDGSLAIDVEGPGDGGPSCVPGPIWGLAFEDHFSGDGAALGPRWHAYNSSGNAGYGLRRPSAVSLWGGSLNIKASMVNGSLVSGGLSHDLDQTYGRYEFRVRTDRDPSNGTSGVVLTWPQSNVHPRDGENNIYETLATPGDRHEFYSFIHEPFGTVHDQDYTVHHADASQWHTMAMEWRPHELRLLRDGEVVKTITETSADLIPDNPHHLTIQLDAWKHHIDASVWMQVDYVKVWSYEGERTC